MTISILKEVTQSLSVQLPQMEGPATRAGKKIDEHEGELSGFLNDFLNPVHTFKHLLNKDDMAPMILLGQALILMSGGGLLWKLFRSRTSPAPSPASDPIPRIVLPDERTEAAKVKGKELPKKLQTMINEAGLNEKLATLGQNFSRQAEVEIGSEQYKVGMACFEAGFYFDAQQMLSRSLKHYQRANALMRNEQIDRASPYVLFFNASVAAAKDTLHLAALETVRPITPYVNEYFEKALGITDPQERGSMVDLALDAVASAYQDDAFAARHPTITPAEPLNLWAVITDALATSQNLVDPAQAVKIAELDVEISSKAKDGRKSEMEALVRLAERENKAKLNINARATLHKALDIARANGDQTAVEEIMTRDAGIVLQGVMENFAIGDIRSASESFKLAVRIAKASGNEAIYNSFADKYLSQAVKLEGEDVDISMAASAASLFDELGDERRTIEALLKFGALANDPKSFNTALERAATMVDGPWRDQMLGIVISERERYAKTMIDDVRDKLDFMNFEADLFAELGDHHRKGEALLRRALVEKRYFVLEERKGVYSTLQKILMDAKSRGDAELFDDAVNRFLNVNDDLSLSEIERQLTVGEVAEVLQNVGEYEKATVFYIRAGEGFQYYGHPDLAKYAFTQAAKLSGGNTERLTDLKTRIEELSRPRTRSPYRESGALGVKGGGRLGALGVKGEGQLGAIGVKKGEGGKGPGKKEREGKERPGK